MKEIRKFFIKNCTKIIKCTKIVDICIYISNYFTFINICLNILQNNLNKKKILIFAKTIAFTFSFFFFKIKSKSFHNRDIKIFLEYWKKFKT